MASPGRGRGVRKVGGVANLGGATALLFGVSKGAKWASENFIGYYGVFMSFDRCLKRFTCWPFGAQGFRV